MILGVERSLGTTVGQRFVLYPEKWPSGESVLPRPRTRRRQKQDPRLLLQRDLRPVTLGWGKSFLRTVLEVLWCVFTPGNLRSLETAPATRRCRTVNNPNKYINK